MRIRYPIHVLVTGELEDTLKSLGELLSANTILPATPGKQIGPRVLIGPRVSLRLESLEHGQVGIALLTTPPEDSTVRAWGIYLRPDAEPHESPLLMVYRNVAALGDHPVLVRENHLAPGELVIVPETSETFVVMVTDEDSPTDAPVQWFVWQAAAGVATPQLTSTHSLGADVESQADSEFVIEPKTDRVRVGPRLQLANALLSAESLDATHPLTPDAPWIQVGPILEIHDYDRLLAGLLVAPWQRREGEIYTQDSLDLLAWCRGGHRPEELSSLLERLASRDFVANVSRLTQMPLTSLKELYAYRLRGNERILVHADSTSEGELLVRMNLLIQAPECRPYDFRFWNPSVPDEPPVAFVAEPNQAVFFLMGKETPHDVPPVPANATRARLNVIMTFGHGPGVIL